MVKINPNYMEMQTSKESSKSYLFGERDDSGIHKEVKNFAFREAAVRKLEEKAKKAKAAVEVSEEMIAEEENLVSEDQIVGETVLTAKEKGELIKDKILQINKRLADSYGIVAALNLGPKLNFVSEIDDKVEKGPERAFIGHDLLEKFSAWKLNKDEEARHTLVELGWADVLSSAGKLDDVIALLTEREKLIEDYVAIKKAEIISVTGKSKADFGSVGIAA